MNRLRPSTQVSSQDPEAAEPGSTLTAGPVLGVLRIVVGWTFLWAFLDKLLALGYATGRDADTGAVDRFGDAAWIHGGSPTYGFLAFGADGPFKDLYHNIARVTPGQTGCSWQACSESVSRSRWGCSCGWPRSVG